MINAAFAAADRILTSRITIDGTVYSPDVIAEIKFNRGLSLADQFEIGTAYSQAVSFTLIDEEGTLLGNRTFNGLQAVIEIGVEDAGVMVYQNMGEYTLMAPEKRQGTCWAFEGTDAMIKADIPYVDGMEYPVTILDIYNSCVAQMGMATDTVTFINASRSVQTKPVYDGMTVREILADIAELAAGFCFIEDGMVRIKGIVQDTATLVTSDNIKVFRRHEEEDIIIDKLIIRQLGATDYELGEGTFPYYINDNTFIQGNPGDFAPDLYAAIKGIQFVPGEVEFNGNPTAILNGWVNLEFLGKTYKFFPLARELSMAGGMGERWISNYLDNLPHDETATDLVRSIRKTRTQLLVVDGKIESTVSRVETVEGDLDDAVMDLTSMINQTADGIFTEVAKTYVTSSTFGDYQTELSTKFEQDADSFTFKFSEIVKAIDAVDGKQAENFSSIIKYISFVGGDILLKAISDDPAVNTRISLKITRDRISFLDNGLEVAYISDNKLYITDGHFLVSLRIGNFAFRPRANGSLSFGKVT